MTVNAVKCNASSAFRSASSQHAGPVCQRRALRLACHAHSSRRDMLVAGGAVLSAPLLLSTPLPATAAEQKYLPVSSLGSFQRSDQREEFRKRAEGVLKEFLTADDSAACLRLVFNDAATYDAVTKTGGMDGSVVLSEEIDRPENASLKPLVAKLAEAKAKIDEVNAAKGTNPISWADLLVLAAKTTTQAKWAAIKIARAETKSGGELIVAQFSNPWPVALGRIDSSTAAPAGRIPAADAPVEEIRKYLLTVGANPGQQGGPFAPKPPLWERPGFVMWTAAAADPKAEEARFAAASPVYADIKKGYDYSRGTVTRTDYEVDFTNYFTKLTSLGAKFNPDAYLYPIPIANVRF